MILRVAGPATVAVGIAFFADLHPLAIFLASACWIGALFAKPVLRVVLLLVAPIALAAGARLELGPVELAMGATIALLSLLPLLLALGGGWPPARTVSILAIALVVSGAAMLTLPASRALLASDVAEGALALMLAAGTLAGIGVIVSFDRPA